MTPTPEQIREAADRLADSIEAVSAANVTFHLKPSKENSYAITKCRYEQRNALSNYRALTQPQGEDND